MQTQFTKYLRLVFTKFKKEGVLRMRIYSEGISTIKRNLSVMVQIIFLILSPGLLCQSDSNIAKLEEIYKAPVGEEAVVAYWKFDGDLKDSSEKGHDIIAQGATFSTGYLGQALNTGIEGYVNNSPDLQLAPGLKIECWFASMDINPASHPSLKKSMSICSA